MAGENYLCFTAEENINISWVVHGTLTETPELLYSIDSTNDWQNYILGTTISLSLGHQCYWKSTTKTFSESANDYITFVSTGRVAANGVIDSLRDFVTGVDSFGYYKIFENCTGLTTAPELRSDFLSNNVYSYMFAGCTSLKVAPALPANYINVSCYENMFYGCTSLVQAPDLPCNFLSENCYRGMFEDCTSLIQAPRLNASNLAVRCYYGMFDGCSNLATLPELPAHQLKTECYKFMFCDCSKIKLSTEQTGEYQRAYKIPSGSGSTTTAVGALDSMFYGTGGTFTNDPTIDVTYYTFNAAPESVDYDGVVDGSGLLKLGRMIKEHVRNTSARKDIEDYIPAQASSQNQLADQAFVNSSIENVAAYYITKNAAGEPFATKAELIAATVFYSGGEVRVPTRNDYCVVLADESKIITDTGEHPTTRYIYDNNTWSYQYIVNRSGLTAAQWAAVNSGITEEGYEEIWGEIDSLWEETDTIINDKYTKPSGGIPKTDLSSELKNFITQTEEFKENVYQFAMTKSEYDPTEEVLSVGGIPTYVDEKISDSLSGYPTLTRTLVSSESDIPTTDFWIGYQEVF